MQQNCLKRKPLAWKNILTTTSRSGGQWSQPHVGPAYLQTATVLGALKFLQIFAQENFWFMPAKRDLKIFSYSAKLIKSEKLTFSSWIFDLWRELPNRSEKFNENSIKVCGTLREFGLFCGTENLQHMAAQSPNFPLAHLPSCPVWPDLRPFCYCLSDPNED